MKNYKQNTHQRVKAQRFKRFLQKVASMGRTAQLRPLRIWAKEMHRITASYAAVVIDRKQVSQKLLMPIISSCFWSVCFLT